MICCGTRGTVDIPGGGGGGGGKGSGISTVSGTKSPRGTGGGGGGGRGGTDDVESNHSSEKKKQQQQTDFLDPGSDFLRFSDLKKSKCISFNSPRYPEVDLGF